MRTVLITGDAPVPEGLREMVAAGSTSLEERRAAEVADAPALDADRVVFWTTGRGDAAIARVAGRYAKAEAAQRREMIVFVTTEAGGGAPVPGLSPNEVYVWPLDEDRLKMAFLTGA